MNQCAAASSRPNRGFANRLFSFLSAVIYYGTDWIKDWRFAAGHRLYIEMLEKNGELDALLEAVGITREQLKASEISPIAAEDLLLSMMQRLCISSEDANAEPLTVARSHCQSCENWRRCRRWLDHGIDEEAYRKFCPNAALFDRLRLVPAASSNPDIVVVQPGQDRPPEDPSHGLNGA